MGEAQRKPVDAAAQAKIVSALRAITQGPRLPGVAAVDVLVLSLTSAQEARDRLGGLPDAVDELLRTAAEMAQAGDAPQVICWERWPSGRQHGGFVPDLKELRLRYCDAMYMNTSARGYELRIASFPAGGWSEALYQTREKYALELSRAARFIERAPKVRLQERDGREVLTVPAAQGEDFSAGSLGQVLRILDGMAATEVSLRKSWARVHLVFEGYDDDPREVTDVPAVRRFIQLLDAHAPWWPLLMAPEQACMWLAPLVSDKPSRLTMQNLVVLEVDDEKAFDLFGRMSRACMDAAMFAGMDTENESVHLQLQDRVLLVRDCLDVINLRMQDVDAGKVKLKPPQD